MRKCAKCGAEIPGTSTYCIYCGAALEAEQPVTAQQNIDIKTHGDPIGTNAPTAEIKIGKAPKISGGKQALISLAAIVIVVIISAVGGKLLADHMENGELREIEEYVEKVENYVPGTIDENGYSSEYWNMRVDLGEGWIVADEEDFTEVKDDFEDLMTDAFSPIFDEVDRYSEEGELIQKSMNSEAEAVAYLVDDDDTIIAQLNILTWSIYGMDESVAEKMAEQADSEFGVEATSVTLAGQKVKRCTYTDFTEGIFLDSFYLEQDGIMMLIQLSGLNNHVNDVRSIYRNFKTY